MKRIGIYLRVSTHDKQSTALQENDILAYLKARDWDSDSKIYTDKATGTNANRDGFKRLMSDVRQRRVDLIICWKLDRLFRSLKDLITTLQEFNELGVEFVSLKDNIDLTTSAGRLMFHIVGAFAEFEASLIKERVKAGVANARRLGKRLGRPPTLDFKEVKSLREQGLSLSGIAKQLGVSRTAVHKSLKKTGEQDVGIVGNQTKEITVNKSHD